MMIKSRPYTSEGFFSLAIVFFFTLFLILVDILNHYSIISVVFFRGSTDKWIFITILLLSFFIAVILFHAAITIKFICIDTEKQLISFKNIITRRETIYKFSDFDEVIDVSFTHNYRANYLGLFKNNKPVRYINSISVSNYAEFKTLLKGVYNYKEIHWGFWGSFKFMLDKKFISLKTAFI